MRGRWSLLLVGAGACMRAADPVPESAASAPAAVEPAAGIVAAKSGDTAASGVQSPPVAATAEAPPVDPAVVPAQDGSVAAFVVVLAGTTIVAPVDPALAPVTADGIWVLDDGVAPAVVRFRPDLLEGYPTCACPEAPGRCDDLTIVGAGAGPICDCLEAEVEAANGDDDDEDYDGGDGEEEEDCETSQSEPVALVGGVLYFHGSTHDGCRGRNIYGAFSESEPVVAAPADLTGRALVLDGCAETDVVETLPPPWPLPAVECDAAALAGREGCDACRAMHPSATVFALHRGRLFRVEDDMDVVGAGPRRWSSAPVGPGDCPSPADTCGPVGGFAGLDAADDYWVANDGSRALRLDGTKLAIVGGAASLARGSTDGGDVYGVRWHADARPLISAMTSRAPRPGPAIGDCRADGECAQTGCSLRCEQGTCVANFAAEPAVLAAGDVGFVDKRGGSGWGGRCTEHMRARRFGAATAACEAGLALAVKPAIRGALLYNLGRIARQTGDAATARARFTASLEVRPNNTVVVQALAELTPG